MELDKSDATAPTSRVGQVAAALVNMGDVPADITLLLSDIVCTSCARKATVVDVWGGDELGSAGPTEAVEAEGSYTASGVHKHETVLLRLTPASA